MPIRSILLASTGMAPSTEWAPTTEISSRTKLLSRDDVEREYGISRRKLELAAVKGDGPRMLKISRKMVRYRQDDIEEWLESRAVNSTSEKPGSAQKLGG